MDRHPMYPAWHSTTPPPPPTPYTQADRSELRLHVLPRAGPDRAAAAGRAAQAARCDALDEPRGRVDVREGAELLSVELSLRWG